MLVTRATAGVLQVQNNYDVINNSACRPRWPVFTGLTPVFTGHVGKKHGMTVIFANTIARVTNTARTVFAGVQNDSREFGVREDVRYCQREWSEK